MTLIRLGLTALVGVVLAFGQEGYSTNMPVLPGEPNPGTPAPYNELRTLLGLTDAQVQRLQELQTTRRNAEAVIYRQIQERQTSLNTLLSQGSTDAARIGTLMVEINNLRRQLPLSSEPYRRPALEVLTVDQRNKLPLLRDALVLQSPAYQAVSLNLIDPYRPPSLPRPLPADLPEGNIAEVPVVSGPARN